MTKEQLIETCITAAKKDAEWFSKQENSTNELFNFLGRTTEICDTIMNIQANQIDKIEKWIIDLSK